MGDTGATDFYELQLLAVEILNSNVEIWLGATFATLVAFHFIGKELTKDLYWIAVVLYAFASGFFFLRFLNVATVMQGFYELSEQEGLEPLPAAFAGYVGVGFVLLFITGTSACLWYMRRCYNRSSPQ